MKKMSWFKKIFVVLMSTLAIACADDDDDNPVFPPGTVQPSPDDDDDNTGSGIDAPWALIRFERHTDIVRTECERPDVDILIVQENGSYRLEECNGVKEGELTRRQLSRIKFAAGRVLRSDMDRQICAEVSPFAETFLTITMDSGETRPAYMELTGSGLCSYGDRGSALALFRVIREIFNAYDFDENTATSGR